MSCINIVIVLSSLSNERLPCHLLLFVISSPVSPLLFFCYSPVLSLSLVLYPSPFSIACHLPLPFLYRLSFTPPLYPSTDPFFYPLLHPTSTLNPITYSLTPPPPPTLLYISLFCLNLPGSVRILRGGMHADVLRSPPSPEVRIPANVTFMCMKQLTQSAQPTLRSHQLVLFLPFEVLVVQMIIIQKLLQMLCKVLRGVEVIHVNEGAGRGEPLVC